MKTVGFILFNVCVFYLLIAFLSEIKSAVLAAKERFIQKYAALKPAVYRLSVPFPLKDGAKMRLLSLCKGFTKELRFLSCHATALSPGSPHHAPHIHKEEEVLFVLHGEVEQLIPHLDLPAGDERLKLKAGQFAFYPSGVYHSLKTISEAPANYVIFKWRVAVRDREGPLIYQRFDTADPDKGEENGFSTRLVLEAPTSHLSKLHCHVSHLSPGAGYEPHVDPYDVAIILLEGEVETLEQTVKAPGIIIYPQGSLHGMSNSGTTMAKYVVFEFHQ